MVSMAKSTRRIVLSILGVLLTVILFALVVFISSWAAPLDETAVNSPWQTQTTQIQMEIVHEPLTTLANAGNAQGDAPLDILWEALPLPYDYLGGDTPADVGDSS